MGARNESVLAVGASLLLREMGYPQKMTPGMIWALDAHQRGELHHMIADFQKYWWGVDVVVAPSVVEALDWLERERGYWWSRTPYFDEPGGVEDTSLPWCAWSKDQPYWDYEADSPSELIYAIHAHWKANK